MNNPFARRDALDRARKEALKRTDDKLRMRLYYKDESEDLEPKKETTPQPIEDRGIGMPFQGIRFWVESNRVGF